MCNIICSDGFNVVCVRYDFSGIFNRESVDPVIAFPSVPAQKEPSFRHGRSLLWSEPSRPDIPSNVDSNYRDIHRMSNKSVMHPTCPLSINQTESLRLDSELRRWIGVERDGDNVTGGVSTGEVSFHLPVPKLPVQKPKRKQRNIRRYECLLVLPHTTLGNSYNTNLFLF
jgi:hypothetical protein